MEKSILTKVERKVIIYLYNYPSNKNSGMFLSRTLNINLPYLSRLLKELKQKRILISTNKNKRTKNWELTKKGIKIGKLLIKIRDLINE